MAGAVRAGPWGRQDEVTGASHPEPRMELVLCPRGNRKLLRGWKQRGPFRRSPWRGGFSGEIYPVLGSPMKRLWLY